MLAHPPEHPGSPVTIRTRRAFKFASALGMILAELAPDGATTAALAPFGCGRPTLRPEDPPRKSMV